MGARTRTKSSIVVLTRIICMESLHLIRNSAQHTRSTRSNSERAARTTATITVFVCTPPAVSAIAGRMAIQRGRTMTARYGPAPRGRHGLPWPPQRTRHIPLLSARTQASVIVAPASANVSLSSMVLHASELRALMTARAGGSASPKNNWQPKLPRRTQLPGTP